MNNVLVSDSGIEIYQSDIDILTDEYISSLPDETMIYKSSCFNGLLLYIYNNKLKHVIDTVKQNKQINNYYIDYDLLNEIFFNVYLPLTCKYNIVPTVLAFCTFVRINNVYMSEIRNGIYNNGSKPNSANTETVKKWYSVCESALADKAFNDNGIGAIFGLKANYFWNDQLKPIETAEQLTQSTPTEIQQRYASAKKPELPILESEDIT